MTRNRWLGPLGRRLLAAFVMVALSSVVVLTLAALVGTERGLATAQRQEREQATVRAAEAAGRAYTAAGGWAGVDLAPTQAAAEAVDARLVVRDADNMMVWPGQGVGQGPGGTHTGGSPVQTAVVVDGQQVGTVRLVFPAAAAGGRTVAWSWVIGAGAVALVAAVTVSWYISRGLADPLVRLADAARRFAAGERTARSGVLAPGELGEVAHAFDTMADEVVRAEAIRRQLAADVAHELRTPLAALQAGLEELRDGLREPDPARLATLHDQTLRLGRVVQDLADLSAAESAALSLHLIDVDLATVAADALAAQEPQLIAAGLNISADLATPAPVRADPDRLHQAITNLLANAARYCRPGDRVTVRVWADARLAVVQVTDTGPGIAPDDLPHVFDRLFRGDASRTVAGSGIGLAVVRELVSAHGGTVDVESALGRGTTFTIRLP